MKSKVITFLVSLLVAFCFWLYVITVISPGSEKTVSDIPVTVQGGAVDKNSGLIVFEDAQLIITDRINQTVTLELEGDRIDLNKLNSNNIFVYLDVSKINDVGPNQDLGYGVDLTGAVSNSAVTVKKRTPATIQVNVEKWSKREIDVELPEITVPEGYHLVASEMKYDDSIMISGPERIVSKVAYAKIAPLNDQTESVSGMFEYVLYGTDGKPLSNDEMSMLSDTQETFKKIKVSVPIKHKKTIVIDPQIIDGGGLTKSDVTVTCTPKQITVYGTEDELRDLENWLNNEWKIELKSIRDGAVDEFDKKKTLEAIGFVNENERVNEITCEIRYNDTIDEKTVKITEFIVEGVIPEGKEAFVFNQSVYVTVRGQKRSVAEIQPTDITVVVEYDKSGTGEVMVRISERFTDVGILDFDKKTVNVTLRDKQRENIVNQNRRG